MYITNIKKYETLYHGEDSDYVVLINPLAVKETRKTNKTTGIAVEIQEPNYLLVNLKTSAIELTSDQLPSIIDAAKHLNSALEQVQTADKAEKAVDRALN